MSTIGEAIRAVPSEPTLAAEPALRPIERRWRVYGRALVRDKLTLAAAVYLVILGLSAIFAPWVTPFGPNDDDLFMRNLPPLTAPEAGGPIPHLLGTDALGRDQLTRLVFGGRVSLAVGLASVAVSGTIGIVLGLVAGFYRGHVDDAIMRLVDVQMGFPSLLLALFVLYAVGGGVANVIFVLAVTRWMV